MFARETVEVDGATFEVFVGGRGEPALCFAHNFHVLSEHGGGAMRQLARIGRTVGVNLRAMGQSSSESDPERLSMAQAVVDLEAIRRKLGIGPWVFVGCSAGGFIGIRYAVEFPTALRGLVLVGTAPSFRVFLDPDSIYCRKNPNYARVQAVIGTQTWNETVWPLVSFAPELVARNAEGEISEARQQTQVSEMGSYDLEKELGHLTVPTLVVHGRYDASMPLAQGQIIASRVPAARLEIFERSGHFPWWEEEAKFERVVREFCQSL
jgi:pimeloyl-ACP methyl ester carboxylesterase